MRHSKMRCGFMLAFQLSFIKALENTLLRSLSFPRKLVPFEEGIWENPCTKAQSWDGKGPPCEVNGVVIPMRTPLYRPNPQSSVLKPYEKEYFLPKIEGHINLGRGPVPLGPDGHPDPTLYGKPESTYFSSLRYKDPEEKRTQWTTSGHGYYLEKGEGPGWYLDSATKKLPSVYAHVLEPRGIIVNSQMLGDMFSTKNYFDESSQDDSTVDDEDEDTMPSESYSHAMQIEDYSTEGNRFGRSGNLCIGPNCVKQVGDKSMKIISHHKPKIIHHENRKDD